MLESGFEIVEDFISETDSTDLLHDFEKREFRAGVGGIRNIDKKSSVVEKYCKSEILLGKLSNYLTGKPSLVRAILFNKTPEQNWLVTWHQDKTVAVSERFEGKGWGPWSLKENTHHVQPPLEVLNNMVTLRIHLDPSTVENGCLKLIPKSHTLGILKQESIADYVSSHEAVTCIAPRRAALIMRPHLLHSSSKAAYPNQRRVLHLEYSCYELPDNVNWA